MAIPGTPPPPISHQELCRAVEREITALHRLARRVERFVLRAGPLLSTIDRQYWSDHVEELREIADALASTTKPTLNPEAAKGVGSLARRVAKRLGPTGLALAFSVAQGGGEGLAQIYVESQVDEAAEGVEATADEVEVWAVACMEASDARARSRSDAEGSHTSTGAATSNLPMVEQEATGHVLTPDNATHSHTARSPDITVSPAVAEVRASALGPVTTGTVLGPVTGEGPASVTDSPELGGLDATATVTPVGADLPLSWDVRETVGRTFGEEADGETPDESDGP